MTDVQFSASRKYKVQFATCTVRRWILPILRRIDVGDYPTKIGRIVGLSRQHVYYYIKKLEKLFSAFQNTFFSDKEPALRKEELE
jgi:hypothetical protein